MAETSVGDICLDCISDTEVDKSFKLCEGVTVELQRNPNIISTAVSGANADPSSVRSVELQSTVRLEAADK